MSIYANEFDPFAAAWLRELMAAGHLPAGIVDERSITDVEATDVRGHRRAHFFAGIAGWELALQLAGWPRDRECWTGSCPCQPYSSAGKRKGNADARDLWPVFARLIRECRPPTVFGEQVASAIRFGWIDRVRADLEAEGYAVGFAVLGAHSVGAPHQRQRLYWCATRPVADSDSERLPRGPEPDSGAQQPGQQASRRPDALRCGADGASRGVGDTGGDGRQPRPRLERQLDAPERAQPLDLASVNGGAVWDHWRDAVGIDCRDGKRRRVPAAQRGVLGVVDGVPADLGRGGVPCATRYPLAGKSPNRAARLRGYGNAICVQTAAAFVKAFLEAERE